MGVKMSAYKILHIHGNDPQLKPYIAMIYSDWLKSLRYGNDWFKMIDSDIYFATYKQLIKRILERPDTIVRLAVLEEENDVCLGWSIAELITIHYVFVKKDYRKQHIGTELMPPNIQQTTHMTYNGRQVWLKKFRDLVFNPFL
jgi:GNAT superfamily N-acetyltransferase